jgi:hypothetical protein
LSYFDLKEIVVVSKKAKFASLTVVCSILLWGNQSTAQPAAPAISEKDKVISTEIPVAKKKSLQGRGDGTSGKVSSSNSRDKRTTAEMKKEESPKRDPRIGCTGACDQPKFMKVLPKPPKPRKPPLPGAQLPQKELKR